MAVSQVCIMTCLCLYFHACTVNTVKRPVVYEIFFFFFLGEEVLGGVICTVLQVQHC